MLPADATRRMLQCENMRRMVLPVILIFFSLCGVAFAQGTGGNPPPILIENPLTCSDFPDCAQKFLTALLQISVPIVAIMVLIGGFQIMTAGGVPEKYEAGKKTILYAVIGFVIVLAADSVVLLIRSIF